MKNADQIRDAWRNLARQKVRASLASLGVVVGTITIVLLVSLASGVRAQIHRQFESIGLDRLMVMPGGGSPPSDSGGGSKRTNVITPVQIARWKKLPGVVRITPEINLPGSVPLEVRWKDKRQSARMRRGMPRLGPGPGMLPGNLAALAGTLDLPEQGGIVLSQGTVRALDIASNEWPRVIAKRIEAILRAPRGETQSFFFRITGISSERSSTVQTAPMDSLAMKTWWFNQTNLLETEGYDAADIQAADVPHAKALIPQLKQEGYRVQSLDLVLEVANRIVVVITLFLGLIASVALVVASIGIANTMVMAIYERTREIGILKALGASRADIRRLFMIEAGLIGLAGGLIGLGLGWGIGIILNQGILWYMKFRDLPIRGSFFLMTPTLAIAVTMFAAAIGVLAGLLPAHRAATLDPLAALRHE